MFLLGTPCAPCNIISTIHHKDHKVSSQGQFCNVSTLPPLQPPWLCGVCLLVDAVTREDVELQVLKPQYSKFNALVQISCPRGYPCQSLSSD